jgi:CARDB
MKRMVFALFTAFAVAMSTAAATFAAPPAGSLLAGGPTAAAAPKNVKGPDLVVPAVVLDSTHPFSYAVTVQNAGTVSANVKGVVVRGVYSPDTTVDPSDTPACQRTLSDTNLTLGVGVALTVSVTCSLAPGAGDRSLLVQVDATNLIRETDETNNVGSVPLADLVVQSIAINPPPSLPLTFSYTVTVRNAGIGAAKLNGVVLQGYFSADQKLDQLDASAGAQSLSGTLAPGGTLTVTQGCTCAPQWSLAYVLVQVDATNMLPESNEANNVASVGLPDLSVPQIFNAGPNGQYPYNYSVMVLNAGSADANLEGVYVQGYYSADTTVDVGDHQSCLRPLSAIVPSGTLPAGVGISFVLSCPVGPAPGESYFLAWVDVANNLAESSESNNVGSGPA